jgi:hypothetical protein
MASTRWQILGYPSDPKRTADNSILNFLRYLPGHPRTLKSSGGRLNGMIFVSLVGHSKPNVFYPFPVGESAESQEINAMTIQYRSEHSGQSGSRTIPSVLN